MRFFWVAVAVGALSAPASADWQYTQWGMSADDVVAASDGSVVEVQGSTGEPVRGQDLRANGNYSAAGMTFKAQFYFSPLSGGLSAIRLHPENKNACPDLEREISGIYSRIGRSEYASTERNLRVRVTNAFDKCFLLYAPVTPNNDTGL